MLLVRFRVQHAEKFAPQFLSAARQMRSPPRSARQRRTICSCGSARTADCERANWPRSGSATWTCTEGASEFSGRSFARRTAGGRTPPKSANSSRTVPMTRDLAALLRDHLAAHCTATTSARLCGRAATTRAVESNAGGSTGPSASTTTGSTDAGSGPPTRRSGDPPRGSTTSGTPQRACRRCQACRCVAAALWHADTSITYKTYLHFFPDPCDADMARFEASLAAPSVRVTPLQREA